MRREFPIIFAILLILISLAYANALHSPFQFDDAKNIANNHDIRDYHNYTKFSAIRYRHVIASSFALNYYLGGVKPFGYHLFNIVVHACATLLVFVISFISMEKGALKGRVVAMRVALVAALFFAIGPVSSEAITYISGRASSLSALLCLLSLFLFILGSLRGAGFILQRVFFFLLSLGAFFAAVLTKETAVILPFLIMIYDGCFMRTEYWERRRVRLICFYSIIPGLVIVFLLKSSASVSVFRWWLNQADLYYALAQIKNYCYAIRLLVFPVNLAIDYGSTYTFDWAEPVFIGSVVLWVGILFLAVKKVRATPILLFATLWFLIAISPTNSFIPREDVLSERNLYLPSFGLVILFSSLLIGSKRPHESVLSGRLQVDIGLCCGVLLTIVTTYSILLVARNNIYRSPLSFWEDTYRKAPGKLRVLHNLSLEYMRSENQEKTLVFLKKMLAIDPFNYFARLNLANIYMRNGETSFAVKEFEDLTRRNPDLFEPYFNLGSYYASQRQFQKAKEFYSLALQKSGVEKSPIVYFYLAKVCYELGLLKDAEANATAYLSADNSSMEANILLAQVFIDTGRESIAEKIYRVDLKKGDSEQAIAHNLLGLLYIRQNKTDKAVSEFEQSIALNPKEVSAHFNIGKLLLENKDFDKALTHLSQALVLNVDVYRAKEIEGLISNAKNQGAVKTGPSLVATP